MSEHTEDPDLTPTLPTVAAGVLRGTGGLCLLAAVVVAALLASRGSELAGSSHVLLAVSALAVAVFVAALLVAFARLVTLAERADTQRLAMLDQLRRLPD